MVINKPYKIAVLDDEADIVDLLKEYINEILADLEIEVVTHTDVDSFFTDIDGDKVDIAIVDINMPQMYGDQVLKKISSSKPKVITFALTGDFTLITAHSCFRKGAIGILKKPVNLYQLEKSLRLATGILDNWNSSFLPTND